QLVKVLSEKAESERDINDLSEQIIIVGIEWRAGIKRNIGLKINWINTVRRSFACGRCGSGNAYTFAVDEGVTAVDQNIIVSPNVFHVHRYAGLSAEHPKTTR